MQQRTGYVMLRDALAFLGTATSRDMSTKIGGVMEPGKHKNCECIEIYDSGNYKDYIFRSPDGLEFKQRVFNGKHKYRLEGKYNLVIKAGFGDVSIATGADGKYSLTNNRGQLLMTDYKVGALYQYVKEHGLKLIYNSIVFSEEICT
jgi:hypothetical protein